MQIFEFGENLRQRAEELQTYAAQPEHWYDIRDPDAAIPGEVSEHVLLSGTIQAVFSWTVDKKGLRWRHLSVSKFPRGLPTPLAVWTLAHLLGFTGAVENGGLVSEPGKKWQVGTSRDPECVVVAEQIFDA